MGKHKVGKEERQRRRDNLDLAIKMVNDTVKLYIAPSEVHGVGVFALRDIKKGERCYANAIPSFVDIPYKRFKEIDKDIRGIIETHFPLVKTGSHFLAPDTLMQIYMNHSDEPNYDNKEDKALKKIKKGEELFEDYKNIEGWEKLFKWIKK